LVQRRQAVSRHQAELDRLNEERTRLTEDEERLRDNYTALKDDPGMRKTTLDKLKAAEAAIDDNTAAAAKATTALAVAQADVTAYVSGLKL
jgi:septation ring formation regulator EzrA